MKMDKMKIGKSLVVIIILLGTCFISGNIVSSTVDTEPIIKNIAKTNNGNEGTEYWALLVAVGVYADDPQQNRPLMLEEIDDFYDLLIEFNVLPEDHIKLIKGEDGTVANIISGFKWLDQMEDEDDISLVYLTTHGGPLGFDIPPFDEEDGTDEVLSSYWGFAYDSQFIYDDQINYRLNTLESKGVCMIVDSCYAGGFNDDSNLIKNKQTSMTAKDWIIDFGEELSGQNRVILMASREDEVSYSGGFAPYLIDGFRGYADINSDDIVTAEEAFYYAQPRTSSRQHPTIFDNYPDELPIIYLNDAIKNSEFEPKNTEKENIATTQSEVSFQENSVINGFVKDADTNDPVEDAVVYIRGRDNEFESFENETTTNSNGYYNINVPPCFGRMTVYADGYCSAETRWMEVKENRIEWINFTMYPRPSENSVIYGYITDDDTGDPIVGADIDLYWEGEQEQSYSNETVSDSSGFYSLNVAAGIIDLEVEANGYFREHINEVTISDYETLQVDISLMSKPAETSVLCGFITDKDTGAPINDARVTIYRVDIELGNEYENDTTTDESGFYSINIPPGELYIDIRKMGYEYYDPYRHDSENEILWFNVSLEEGTIEVDFAKPLRAVYIFNNRLFPYNKARIIGSIDIEAYVSEGWYGQGYAEKVEFYIDDVLKGTVDSEPYLWTWSEKKFGEHTIKVIAYDNEGITATKEIEVYKFL